MTGPRVDPLAAILSEPEEDPLLKILGEGSSASTVPSTYGKSSGYGKLEDLGKGLLKGAKSGVKSLIELGSLATGDPTAIANQAMRTAQRATQPQEPSSSGWETAGKMLGQTIVEAPLMGGLSAGVRGAASQVARKVSSPLVQQLLTGSVPGSFWKSAAAAVPINMVESVALDAVLHPENVATKEGVVKSALLGSTGALLGAKKGAIGNNSGAQFGPFQKDHLGEILADSKPPKQVPFWRQLDQKIADPAAPFKEFDTPQAGNSAYNLARRLNASDAIDLVQGVEVQVPVRGGGYRKTGNPTTHQLIQKIGADPETLAEWDKYLLGKSGLKLSVDDADVQAQVSALEIRFPQFKDAILDYKKKVDDIADTYHGYGFIDDEVRDYVPTGRAMTNANTQANHLKPKTNTESLREIRSPMQQLFTLERKLIQRGEDNKLGMRMLQEVRSDPDKWKGRIEEQVVGKDAPIEEEMKILEAQYRASGMPVPGQKTLRAQAMMTSDEVLDGSTGKMAVYENGSRINLLIDDPLIKEFFQARKFPENEGVVMKGYKAAERFTTRAFFQPLRELTGKNAALDQIEAFMNTKWNEYVPGWDWMKGVWAQTTKDPRINDIRMERGLIATRFANPNAASSAKNFEEFVKEAAVDSKVIPMGPVKAISELMGIMSAGTRVGAGLRKLEATGHSADAAVMARNVIADPQQMGTAQSIKLLSNSSFANYGIQSTRRMMQAASDNPLSFATKGIMGITLPSVGFWLANRNDEEITRLRKSKGGENYWYVRNPSSSEIYAVQKPYFQGQLFGTSMEAALDGMEPRAAEQFAQGLVANVMPNVMPITTGLAMELTMGKNFMGFLNEAVPLVPGRAEGALPEDRAGTTTFGVSKDLAGKFGVSAAKIDNVLKTILFSQGTDIADRIDRKIYDRIAPETKVSLGNLIPAVKKVNPNRSNVEPLNNFYDKYAELEQVSKSFDLAVGSGDAARAMQVQQQYGEQYKQFQAYDAMNEVLGTFNQNIRFTMENKSLTAAERRERVDKLRKTMIERVDIFNKIFGVQ
jgi:hypothetical protein